jgi:hypothetical protein
MLNFKRNNKINSILLLLWVAIPMFLYLKNFGYLYLIVISSSLFLLLIILIKIIYSLPFNTEINSSLVHRAIIDFIGKKEIKLKPIRLFFGFIFLIILNTIALTKFTLPPDGFNINLLIKLFFYSISLFERVGTSLLFLLGFLLIAIAIGNKNIKKQ